MRCTTAESEAVESAEGAGRRGTAVVAGLGSAATGALGGPRSERGSGALGRVLAHELYHMLTKTQHHAGEGVTRSALSPAALIAKRLTMIPAELRLFASPPMELIPTKCCPSQSKL